MKNEIIELKMRREDLAEYIYEHVYPKIEAAGVMKQLEEKDVYCKEWCDFTLSYYIDMDELYDVRDAVGEDMQMTTIVGKALIDSIGLDVGRLEESALNNIDDSYMLVSMEEMLARLAGILMEESAEPQTKMMILTNKAEMFGAAALMSRKAVAEIEQIFGSEFYILPSSVHEVIATPIGPGAEDMTAMVREVNATQVAAKDRLADTAFVCRNGKITVAA